MGARDIDPLARLYPNARRIDIIFFERFAVRVQLKDRAASKQALKPSPKPHNFS